MSGFYIDAMNQAECARLVTRTVENLPQEFLTRLEKEVLTDLAAGFLTTPTTGIKFKL